MSYTDELFGLQGVKVVITGGAGVIPGAMAEALLGAGAEVCLWGRGTGHPVQEAVDRLVESTGAAGRVFGVTVDTGDESSVEAALQQTVAQMGPPTALINGVGGNKTKSAFPETDVPLFEEVLVMNVMAGLVVPTKIFSRYWIANKLQASIINLASMASYIPLSGVAAYGAAKAAVMNLTLANAREFAQHGIRVNAIAPGFFLGYQNRSLLIKDDATGELTDRGKAIIAHTPFGRFGNVDDLKGTTVYLVSQKASGFITGVTVPIDGGYLTHNV
ncbi:MAG: SDR family oxidoreductase [Spirochaetaceae bacterium]|nr:MAG: SDR family oxidoreductase [Spirochaetaceae bacterium]